jgi:hypothetical protein
MLKQWTMIFKMEIQCWVNENILLKYEIRNQKNCLFSVMLQLFCFFEPVSILEIWQFARKKSWSVSFVCMNQWQCVLILTNHWTNNNMCFNIDQLLNLWHTCVALILKIYSGTCLNQTYLGPTFVFGIDRCLLYTG